MKLKTDENIPQRLVEFLRERRHEVATVQDEHLVGASDDELAEVASGEGRVLLTLDRGFADIRRYPPGSHPGIIVVHARELRPNVILTLVSTFLTEHTFEDFTGCNVVIEPGSIRARRPQGE